MNRRLEGKVAIITGTPIEDVVQKIRHYSGKAIAYAGDVSQEFHAQNCVQTAINAYELKPHHWHDAVHQRK